MAGDRVKRTSEALYNACLGGGVGRVYSAEELQALKTINPPDLQLLTECINHLTSGALFKQLKKNGLPCWRVVSREHAEKVLKLSDEEAIVLSYIEDAGRDGIWTKTIRTRSNLPQIPMTKALKSLEYKHMIKQMHNARNPTRKLYILATLQPNEDVAGGPFYSDGVLDEDFIRYACLWLVKEITRQSWIKTTSKSNKRRKMHTKSDASGGHADSHGLGERVKYLPYPAGYEGYPTVGQLARGLNEAELTQTKLKEAEVEQLLNLMRWDGKIEHTMNGKGYKATWAPESEGQNSHEFIETPCGRCPVFELCDDSGPVNAKTCEYFPEWFEL